MSKMSDYAIARQEDEEAKRPLATGTRVKIPGFGGRGRVVRYSKGDPHGSPFYIVDVGRHASEKIPAHQVVRARPWAWDSRVGYGGEMRWGRGRDAELDH